LILMLAILNGGVRETWLTPRWGARTGHVVSTLLLSGVILASAWLTIRWIRPSTTAAALRVGTIWLVLTLGFEFLAGHYLFGRTWASLWAEYDLTQGRIWVLIPLVTLLAPPLAGHARGLYR
jgi:hypothetical protein